MEKMRWLQYRSAVCSDVVDVNRNYPIAIKPALSAASKKGNSGWTRHQPDNVSYQAFPQCLSSSVPIHLHTQNTHAGRCLKRIPTRLVSRNFSRPPLFRYF